MTTALYFLSNNDWERIDLQTLVIGASGSLGGQIYDKLKSNGEAVVGTYSSHRTSDGLIKFELGKDTISSIDTYLGDGLECAVFCAAMTSIDKCKKDAEKARLTNVDATIQLIDELHSKGCFIIFFSTADVYDGTKGNYAETDDTHPVNEYGRTKLQVEQYIVKNNIDACILRIAKVVGDIHNSKDVFRDWLAKAKKHEDIYCISGKYDSFVDVDDVADCVEIVKRNHLKGIFNIAGNESCSRMEACKKFFGYFNMRPDVMVCEKKLSGFNFSDNRALDTSIDNGKAREILGYNFKSLEQIFEKYKILITKDSV